MGAAATARLFHSERQSLLLPCAHWHCHGEEKGQGVPFLGCAGTKTSKTLGDNDARTSPQWLSVCPQEDRWRNGPIFRRNKQPFSCVRCMILLFIYFILFFEGMWGLGGGGGSGWVGMTRPETVRRLTANWFPDHVDRSKFRHLSEFHVNI